MQDLALVLLLHFSILKSKQQLQRHIMVLRGIQINMMSNISTPSLTLFLVLSTISKLICV